MAKVIGFVQVLIEKQLFLKANTTLHYLLIQLKHLCLFETERKKFLYHDNQVPFKNESLGSMQSNSFVLIFYTFPHEGHLRIRCHNTTCLHLTRNGICTRSENIEKKNGD